MRRIQDPPNIRVLKPPLEKGVEAAKHSAVSVTLSAFQPQDVPNCVHFARHAVIKRGSSCRLFVVWGEWNVFSRSGGGWRRGPDGVLKNGVSRLGVRVAVLIGLGGADWQAALRHGRLSIPWPGGNTNATPMQPGPAYVPTAAPMV